MVALHQTQWYLILEDHLIELLPKAVVVIRESGVLNSLLRTFHDLVEKNDSVVIDCPLLKVVSFHAENDGTALKPGLQFDPTQKSVVGLATGNLTADYINANKDKSPELTRHLRTI